MIMNEREYRITKAQADRFEQALSKLEQEPRTDLHPLVQKAQLDGLRGQLLELREQLQEYDALKTGAQSLVEISSFDELPEALIKGRIAARLSQKELAERLGLKEQQIQRYEATRYEAASFARIIEIANALGIHVRNDLMLASAKISASRMLDRLVEAGMDQDLLTSRVLPRNLVDQLASKVLDKGKLENLTLHAASLLSDVFGFKPTSLFEDAPLELRADLMGASRFKVSTKADANYLRFYTPYAHHLAHIVLQATSYLEQKPIPTDPLNVRQEILGAYGNLTFESILNYVWNLGIPVIPLGDKGAFQGACWRISGRNIIVLKQHTPSQTRWAFDLLHETRHAGQDPDEQEFALVEPSSQDEEITTNLFAGDVLLDGRSEDLFKLCIERANNDLRKLKSAVSEIGTRNGVPVPALANYVAFRLSLQGENWWSTANNLQDTGNPALEIARRLLFDHLDFKKLNTSQAELLIRALSDVIV